MNYGIIASSMEIAQSVAAPSSLQASYNFVSGTYSFGGTSLTAAQVVDQNGWIGASGLSVPSSAGYGAALLYAPLNTFLGTCEFTIVAEVEVLSGYQDIITIAETGSQNYIELAVYVDPTAGEWDLMDGAGDVTRNIYFSHSAIANSIHTVAFSRDNSHFAMAVDGSATQVTTSSFTLPAIGYPMTDFYLGGWVGPMNSDPINIRSVAFYDKQEDSILPSMSI